MFPCSTAHILNCDHTKKRNLLNEEFSKPFHPNRKVKEDPNRKCCVTWDKKKIIICDKTKWTVFYTQTIYTCYFIYKKNIYNFRKNENCIVSYFGCIDHCSCVGLCVVTASSSARLVTSDQLHKHRYLQINTGHIVKVARRCGGNELRLQTTKCLPCSLFGENWFCFQTNLTQPNSQSALI